MKLFKLAGIYASLMSSGSAAVLITGSTGNGNFETILNGATGQVNFSTGNVASWTSWSEFDSAANDTGVTNTAPDRRAFLQPGPNIGTNGGAIRSTVLDVGLVGTTFTYGFDYEGSGGNATIVLLYNSGGVFLEIPGSSLRSGAGAFGTVGTYSRTLTIAASDAWANADITVGLRNSLATDGGAAPQGQFPNIDNVVFSSVPEPTSLMLTSLGMVGFFRRRR